MRRHPESLVSIHRPTVRTTTGMCLCLGCGQRQLYGYRVSGTFDPSQGLPFDESKVLLDPYGREVVVPVGYSREEAARNGCDNAATAMKSVVVDPHTYDWGR